MSVRRLRVGEVELAFEEAGSGERALVLVHGLMGSRGDFARQWQALARIGRTVALDLRGHGASGRLGEAAAYTLDALAADLLAWLDAVGLERVDLLGHSMGGMVALRAALAAPARVASLVLMNTSARPLAHLDRARLELAAKLARERGMAALAELMQARAAEDPSRSAADRRVEAAWGAEPFWRWRRERLAAMDPEAFAALGTALHAAEPLVHRLAELACPVLVLVGEEDEEFLAPSYELVREIPRARLAVLPGAAHQPQHEAPDAWLEAIRAHLARVRGAFGD